MLPTGTVTFAFTDIEGSAQRWDRDRAAMQGALRRHDDLLRSAVENQNGHVFKTMGDACCSVFARPEDAIAAMADAQRVVAAEDFSAVDGLRVRAAIHTGTSDERDGDYFGPAVNRVARLMSIGHGGQILVSGATRELAHSDLPAGTTLVDLGSQRLRDLTDPEHVWQLSIGGLQSEFPPLRSLNAFPNNLPIQRTSFVGRESDVAAVKKLLGRHRLLTLAGSGGVGKTRLALQVGAALLDRYPDGVWVVDFAPITDPELVSSVIAQVLGMSQQEGRRIDESIPLWLKRKKLLLIFDNCEHIVDIAASLADAILATAQDVRILTTSRQPLDVGGEALHRLPSLSVPTEAVGLRMDEALRYGAIALFVDRAQTADTRFTLTNDTAPVVAEICRRLDGIPLAIELVAARVKVLSIPNLAHRLNERFRLLTGGSRSALPRQKTLSALIDWSYDLLTVQEQLLFTRLGIFAGEFGLEAVSAVCSGAGLDEIESFDLLTSLTDKSLVVADTSGERERYRLLESTRAYAFEKLALDERARLARRHGEYFRSQADAARERFGTGSTFAWVAGVELELDDYRAALAWGLTQSNDAVVGGAIAGALSALWNGGGLGVEGRYWIGLALERVSDAEQPRIAARLWYALTPLSYGTRKRDAAERAMQLYASVGDVHWAANARVEFAWGLYQMGRLDEAGDAIARALAALRTCGDQWGVAGGLNIQAAIALNSGNRHSARELFAQALATYKALGNEIEAAVVLGNMAELEFGEGRPEEALRLGAEALEINVCGKNTESIALAHVNGAAYRIALADLTGARASAREGLRWSRQAGVQLTIAISLQHLAVLAGLGGNSRSAAELLGYVDAQYRELGLEREPTEQSGYDTLQAALHDTLSGDEIAKLAAQGAAWSEDRAVEEALKV
ncbi:MAG TPA: adenylate/guanylate cyclase domain-containing protein [Candidatus Tumulicola sp.]